MLDVKWRRNARQRAQPDHRVVTREDLIAIAASLQQRRDGYLCSELSDEAKVCADSRHGQMPCAGAIAAVERGLGLYAAVLTQMIP